MHRHQDYFNFLKNRELDEIYISMAIRSFALSMISVFIPIYLLKLNYSLTSVLIFFAVFYGAHSLLVIPASKISSKFGFKHAILYSVPLLIIFFILLFTLESYGWPLILLAAIGGASNSLFWVAFHVDFSKFSHKKSRGKEISFSQMISNAFSIFGPIVGGLILAFISFKLLFLVVSILLFVSTFPLFFSKDIHEPINFSVKQIFTDQKFRDYLFHIGYGIEKAVAAVIWPIFIFFSIFNNFLSLGVVTTISMFSSLAFIFFVGKFSDKYRKRVLKLGVLFTSAIWGIKIFAKTFLHVFILDLFHGASRTAIIIPFDASSYDNANKGKLVEFIMFREIVLNLASVVLFILMIFLADYISSFMLGGISILLMLF